MRFRFEIEGQVQFDRAFNRLEKHVDDLRPLWPFVERAFYTIESEQFKSEGSKGRTGKWKPLSRPYAEQKAQRYGVQPILRASGRMERSLTGKTGDTLLVATKEEFGIGTRLFYPVFHQTGTAKMPAREPVSFSNEQRTYMQKEMQKGLLRIIRGDAVVRQAVDVS